MVFVGDPRTTSAFFMIPHAGFRYGISSRIDAGLRLAPIPLPFATVGPGFGMNLDVKFCLTSGDSPVQAALVAGAGGAHVVIQDRTRLAYSPNAAGLLTWKLSDKTQITGMGRYVHLAIPTAPEGRTANFTHIAGVSVGLKYVLSPGVSILPEAGIYRYEGQIAGVRTAGPGFQYGIMIATTL